MQIWLYRAFFVVLQLISTHQAMRRHLLFLAVLLGLLTTVQAQDNDALNALKGNLIDPVPGYVKPFSHLDISLTTGSTGLGFDVSMPINNVFSLRTGYAFMPHVKHMMHFGVDVGDDPAESQSKFDRLSGMLAQFTGMEVDNIVDVEGQPTYWNWKLLVDVKPFRNKNWHLTAGIFLGSHEIARAKNTTEDMPSLMAVNIYNNLFTRSMNGELFTFDGISFNMKEKFEKYGMMSIHMGEYKHDILYDEDVVYEEDVLAEKNVIIDGTYYMAGDVIHAKGEVIHAKGEVKHQAGTPYRVVPDENSMVKAWAYANRLKPYIGFGYGGRLLKKDDSWHVSFDCGAMFWGGVPKIVTHDGTDLVNDVENVRGKVGDYVDLIKKFQVFPVLNLRITKRIF